MSKDIHIEWALSIRQPWAWLIARNYKDIENRSWSTDFRGYFAIHAAKRFDIRGYEWVLQHFRIEMAEPHQFRRGGIIGVVRLIDCVTHNESPWFEGPYGFALGDAREVSFSPMPGKLGFFELDQPISYEIRSM